jgi:hypothetical protein
MAMQLQILLTGQLPSGKNQVRTAFVHGRVMKFPNPRFKAWRKSAFQQLQDQRRSFPIVRGQARVEVLYWPGDRLRRDVPGMMDALCHLLEHCPVCRKKNKACSIPVVLDDSLLAEWSWKTMELDRARPRAEITIVPYQTQLPQGDQKS